MVNEEDGWSVDGRNRMDELAQALNGTMMVVVMMIFESRAPPTTDVTCAIRLELSSYFNKQILHVFVDSISDQD